MTPDMETPLWMLLVVALGLWLLWAAVCVGDRRRSSLRLIVVLTQRREEGAPDDGPLDQQPQDDEQDGHASAEREHHGSILRGEHQASVSAVLRISRPVSGAAAADLARAWRKAQRNG